MNSYDQYKKLDRPIDYLMECWIRSLSPDPAEKAEFNWAFMELVDDASENPERTWKCILHALGDSRFAEHFAVLAAGPVEDLLSYHGAAFIERVEALAQGAAGLG